MHRWNVGTVEVVRVESFDIALPGEFELPAWAVPMFAPAPGEHRIADSATAIRDDDVSLVIDPWLITDWSSAATTESVAGYLAALAEAGFRADEVDIVVNSHFEAIGGNAFLQDDGSWRPAFPNATYHFPSEDLAAAASGSPDHADLAAFLTTVDLVGLGDGHRCSPSVRTVRTDGHGPGHQAVRIESGDEVAVYVGHLVSQVCQFADPARAPLSQAEPPVRARVLADLADEGAIILTALLGGPGGGRVHRDGTAFRLEPV